MSELTETLPIVIDNGTGVLKAGFAGSDETPSVMFPSVYGTPKQKRNILAGMGLKQTYIGHEARSKRGILKLKYAMDHGIVQDWDIMEKIWHYAFYNHLRVSPSKHPVLITEAPMNPKKNREKMTEIMFEKFDIPCFYVAIQAVLSLYSSGRTTGVVLDIGDGVSHTVPVYEGYNLPHANQRLELAGRDLTNYMIRLLMGLGLQFKTSSEKEIARDIKEKMTFVSSDYQNDLQNFQDHEKEYTLPSGEILKLGKERFQCPEILYQPSMYGVESAGIHEITNRSIQASDIDLRKPFYGNIVLSGGTTCIEGFKERLDKEMSNMVPTSIKVKVIAPEERYFSCWIGGSILASLQSFSQMWITKEDFEEAGVKVVHAKCF